jgi:hypothetical protein
MKSSAPIVAGRAREDQARASAARDDERHADQGRGEGDAIGAGVDEPPFALAGGVPEPSGAYVGAPTGLPLVPPVPLFWPEVEPPLLVDAGLFGVPGPLPAPRLLGFGLPGTGRVSGGVNGVRLCAAR